VGFDLVALGEVEEAIACFGDRYLRRVFTEAELYAYRGHAARLAACFAAKEATIKALMPSVTEAVPWQSISVPSSGSRNPSITLTGQASRLARRRGISHLRLGLSRTGTTVGAVVIAMRHTATER
jgi:holo-[acyl-carrier protein] synthase